MCVIAAVTAVAGIGGIGIITVVAGIAIIGDGHVRTHKWINGIVIESRRRPGGLGVAKRAVGGILLCRMVRVGGLCVIAIVATVAGVGGVIVVSIVTGGTVTGNGYVCAGNRVVVIVSHETCRSPT